jgi:tetratricopeptide (TPR) repeat protein
VNRFLVGMLLGGAACAQVARPPSIPQPLVMRAPYEEWSETPTSAPVSVRQLQHKISKPLARSYQHALKLSRKGDHRGAAAELEAAIGRDPEFSQAENQLGIEYSFLGRWAEADAAFRRSLKLDPSSWNAEYNLAIVLCVKGDLPAAEQSTRHALRLSGENPHVHLLLGELLVMRNDTSGEGLSELKIAARTMPDAQRVLRTLGVR